MLKPTTDHSHLLGDVVGRYRLIGEVARGGMGIVYVAAAQGPAGFSKLVALKELRPDLAEDGEFLTMFLEEARMAARLNHPNIVQTNDVDACDGRHFIAMEYLEGRSLYHVLKRFAPRGGFPQRMALSVLRDALAALDYAHELAGFDGQPLGFVHRDISPHNIFLTYEGHTKVIDFGIAKARDSSLETKTGVLKGRANYMAPEQLLRRTDRRSDVFSIGAILYEVLSGRRLWQGMNEVEILAALARGELPSLQTVRPDAPPELMQICNQALCPIEQRYGSAAEMRDALDQYLWATGGTPRLRDVSDTLMHEFEADRQRTRAVIEAALYRLEAGERGTLEALGQGDPRDSESRVGSGGSHRSRPSGRVLPAESPSARRRELMQPMPSRVSASSLLNPVPSRVSRISQVSQVSQIARATRSHSVVAPLPAPDQVWTPLPNTPFYLRKRHWVVAAGLAAVFVTTTFVVAWHQGAASVEAQLPAPPTGTQPAAGAAVAPGQALSGAATLPAPGAPAPSGTGGSTVRATESALPASTIVLSVSVTPSTAQLHIDGQALPSNPFVGRFQRTPGVHRVRASAPGYQSKERLVTFDDNVMIDLSLPPNAAPSPPPRREASASRREAPSRRAAESPPHEAPAAVAAPAPPPSRAVASEPEMAAPRPRLRAIDTKNPYGDEK